MPYLLANCAISSINGELVLSFFFLLIICLLNFFFLMILTKFINKNQYLSLCHGGTTRYCGGLESRFPQGYPGNLCKRFHRKQATPSLRPESPCRICKGWEIQIRAVAFFFFLFFRNKQNLYSQFY